MDATVSFGAMAAPLAEQLQCPAKSIEAEQRDADAITRLAVRGLLSEAEVHRARKRLVRNLERRVLPYEVAQ